jgi:hypothetical protein
VTTAAPTATAPPRPPAWPVAVLFGLLLLPVVVLLARQLVAGLPEIAVGSDPAVIELATLDAARGRQLLGPYSRFGFHHPGPAMFYVLLPGYLLGGRTHGGLLLGALLVNLLALASIAVAASRLGERRLSVAVLVLVPLLVLRIGPAGLSSAWNPNLVVPAFVLTVVGAVAVAAGERALLPVLVAAGSFAAQSHLGLVAPVATVFAVTAAARLVTRLRRALDHSPDRPRSHWPTALAVAVAVVIWAPVAIEQLSADGPGNVSRIVAFVTQPRTPQPLGAVVTTYGGAAGSWLTAALAPTEGGTTAVVLGLALALVQPAVLALAVRRRRWLLVAVSALGLALVPVALVSLRAVAGPLHEYLTRWIAGLGLVHGVAMTAALLPCRLDGAGDATRTRGPVLALAVAVAVLVAGVSLVRVTAYPSWREQAASPVFARIGRANTAAGACAAEGPVHVWVGGGTSWELAAGIVLRLAKDGRAVSVDPEWAFMFGSRRAGAVEGARLLVCEAGPTCVAGETVWQEEGARVAVLPNPG